MNDPFGTLLASFWCDIVEAYTLSQGGHELQQKRFFHLWKEDYDAQFPDKLLEFENKQVKTAWPSLIHDCLSLHVMPANLMY